MINKKSILPSILSLLTSVLIDVAYAQNQTVVIPLNSTRPVILAYDGGNQTVNLPSIGTDIIVRSVTLDTPNKGVVIVNASGYFEFYYSSDPNAYVLCSITQGTSFDPANAILAGNRNTSTYEFPFAGTRAFPVAAGNNTFNFVCKVQATDDLVRVEDTNINAIYYYVPNVEVPLTLKGASPDNSRDCTNNVRECN